MAFQTMQFLDGLRSVQIPSRLAHALFEYAFIKWAQKMLAMFQSAVLRSFLKSILLNIHDWTLMPEWKLLAEERRTGHSLCLFACKWTFRTRLWKLMTGRFHCYLMWEHMLKAMELMVQPSITYWWLEFRRHEHIANKKVSKHLKHRASLCESSAWVTVIYRHKTPPHEDFQHGTFNKASVIILLTWISPPREWLRCKWNSHASLPLWMLGKPGPSK